MLEESKYRLITARGIIAVVINGKKILLLKRMGFPNPRNPGIWTFISGRKDKRLYLDVAYKELREESGLRREQLTLMGKGFKVCLFERRTRQKWYNQMFIFKTDVTKIKLNFENTAYRWATRKDLEDETEYTNIFINESAILKKIRSCFNGSKKPKGKN